MDIYRALHPTRVEFTFFSSIHETLYKDRPYILGHKTNLSKFKRMEFMKSMFSDHSGTKVKVTNRKITGKSINTWKSNNTLLNNSWIKEDSSGEVKKNTLKGLK